MVDDDKISAGTVLQRQSEVFEDFVFTESFEAIMLLFMLSRYDYLEHIDRHQGYLITDKLIEDFPLLDDWQAEHPQYEQLLKSINCEQKSLEILFRRGTWWEDNDFLMLDLSDLLISNLEVDLFRDFSKLTILNLNHNLLGTLPAEIFYPLPRLKKLNLSYNMISKLPIHIFSENPDLESLNLAKNGIDNRWLQKFKALNRLSHRNLEIKI